MKIGVTLTVHWRTEEKRLYGSWTCMDPVSWCATAGDFSPLASHTVLKRASWLSHIYVCTTPADMFSKYPMKHLLLPLCHQSSTFRTRPRSSLCLCLSLVLICADRWCFSAWRASSSAWMNSDQIKLALTDSDLPGPPLISPPPTRVLRVHTLLFSWPTPLFLFLFWHFSSFCHLGGPAECWGASVAQKGVQIFPAGSYLFTKVLNTFWSCNMVLPFYFFIQFKSGHKMLEMLVWLCVHPRCETLKKKKYNYASYIDFSHFIMFSPKRWKKFLIKLVYLSVMYSARILGELYPPTSLSVWVCRDACQICEMPVGCSQERHGALIQHKQGHKTTTQPLVQSLLQISPAVVRAHHR